jgi:hypothetical protein
MQNLNRILTDDEAESRENPRIQFHCPAAVVGVDPNARVVDFSLSGFYIETKDPSKISPNQKVNIFLKLPEEKAGVTIRATVVHRDDNGFGCEFNSVNTEVHEMLSRCFQMFSCMLPID